MLPQSTNAVLMVRPASFGYNTETAQSNAFQNCPLEASSLIQKKALAEFDDMVKLLENEGIDVLVIQDSKTPAKPDAIFPNNWLSTLHDGSISLFPMLAVNRRTERRDDIIETLARKFDLQHIHDYSQPEQLDTYLEGTGSIVFDHRNRKAYACRSPRTDPELFEHYCNSIKYQAVIFDAVDEHNKAIYHTNVLMAITTKIVIICAESIDNNKDKVLSHLTKSGRTIIEITFAQMNCFAGNMLALIGSDNHKLLILSQSAYNVLTKLQKTKIQQHLRLVPIKIPTIEKYGGESVRCMMTEIFLPKI